MTVMLIRTVIIYLAVIIGVRLMGKRQIGELQPEELVVTILISDVATQPLESMQVPLLLALMVIMLLVAFELLFSVLSLKFRKFRLLLQGHAVSIIKNGEIDQAMLRKVRYTVDDMMESLRLKDVFDVSDVSHAYVEPNGSVSVLQKPAAQNASSKQQGRSEDQLAVLPCLVISDGNIVTEEFSLCGLDLKKLHRILKKENKQPQNIFLMTYATDGTYHIVDKKEAK